jgi:hypothetical protein
MWLRFRLLTDCGLHTKVKFADRGEHAVTHCLSVSSGMEIVTYHFASVDEFMSQLLHPDSGYAQSGISMVAIMKYLLTLGLRLKVKQPASSAYMNLSDITHITKRTKGQNQLDRFREAAREVVTDDAEARFNDKLGRLAKPKPEANDKPEQDT